MRNIAPFDPTSADSGSFDPGIANPCGLIYLFNESPIGLSLTFPDRSTATLPPYFFRFYRPKQPGIIQWSMLYSIPTTSTSNSVYGESYESNELDGLPLVQGPLNRQTNVGNSVPVGTSATAITNTGNSPQTSIITAQPSDAASATWSADNSGNLAVKSDNAGVLSTLLQLIAGASPAVKLAAAAILTEVLGNLQVDGTLSVNGTTMLTGTVTATNSSNAVAASVLRGTANLPNGRLGANSDGDILDANSSTATYLKSRGSGGIIFLQIPNGNTIAAFQDSQSSAASTDGLGSLTVPKLFFNIGAIKDINNGLVTTAGTVTINHGLSGSPAAVLSDCSTNGSTATTGASNYTSTQFTFQNGSGISLTFRWFAYR